MGGGVGGVGWGEGVCPCALTKHQHGCHNQVRHERETTEDEMCSSSEPCPDHLQEGLGSWCPDLQENIDYTYVIDIK